MASHNAKSNRLNESPLHMLHRAKQCAIDAFSKEVGATGLTPRQLTVLITVAESEGISQTGIGARTGMDRSTTAEIVTRMVNKGLLRRQRVATDTRAYAVKLTVTGRAQLQFTDPIFKRIDALILGSLGIGADNFLDNLGVIEKALSVARRKDILEAAA